MEISKKTRPYASSYQLAVALCETARILYSRDSRLQYLQGLIDCLTKELGNAIEEEL